MKNSTISSAPSLILGAGEVGKSLHRVLSETYNTIILDKNPEPIEGIYILHICFPYFQGFEQQVEEYKKMYNPNIIIIHSTVPVGTSRKLGALHSPIHGKHPNLSGGIKTFTKYLGGENENKVLEAAKYLDGAGIKVQKVSSPETSELSKILCTTYYGWNILFNKEAKRLCDELGVNFDEAYGWNKHYNEGYEKLGMGQFRRPVLDYVEGKIGGHCVVQNCDLLESFVTSLIKEKNESY